MIGGLLFIASMIMLPWGQNDDGSPRRLIDVNVRGRNNATNISGERSPQIYSHGRGAIQAHTDSGTINIVEVTASEARQISIDAGRSVLLPEINAIGLPEARATAEQIMNKRLAEFTEMTLDRINVKNPTLFTRFADPRFLAPLARAHRSYAEIGDAELGEVLAGLLSDTAAEQVRTPKEIVLRRAIDCAPLLTQQQIIALGVNLEIKKGRCHPRSVDELLEHWESRYRPYYGTIPTRSFDYTYIGTTDAGSFNRGSSLDVYRVLHYQYMNVMYTPFVLSELPPELISSSDISTLIVASAQDVRHSDESGETFRLREEGSPAYLV